MFEWKNEKKCDVIGHQLIILIQWKAEKQEEAHTVSCPYLKSDLYNFRNSRCWWCSASIFNSTDMFDRLVVTRYCIKCIISTHLSSRYCRWHYWRYNRWHHWRYCFIIWCPQDCVNTSHLPSQSHTLDTRSGKTIYQDIYHDWGGK